MTSLQSSVWRHFLNPLYSKNSRLGSRLNIKLSRLVEAPFPPRYITRKYRVVTTQAQASNIFTIVPGHIANDKIILYLHGGAYIAGITKPHWRFIDKIIDKAGIRIAVVDYPTAPEHSCHDVFKMLLPVYQNLLNEYLPSQIIFMGDSAGGGLALALAQKLQADNTPLPAYLILLSPWLDVTMTNPAIVAYSKRDKLLSRQALVTAGKHYADGTDTKNPLVSPIYGNFNQLPTIHLFMGTSDILAPDALLLRDSLVHTQVDFRYYEYNKMFHVWMFYPIPEAKSAIRKIVKILTED